MTDRELLLDACYAYEALAGLGGMSDRHREAYKKLRAKLSEPERKWVGLTEKETIDLALNAFALPEVSLEQRLHLQFELVKAMNEPDSRLMIFAATIEDKLKEKNA